MGNVMIVSKHSMWKEANVRIAQCYVLPAQKTAAPNVWKAGSW